VNIRYKSVIVEGISTSLSSKIMVISATVKGVLGSLSKIPESLRDFKSLFDLIILSLK